MKKCQAIRKQAYHPIQWKQAMTTKTQDEWGVLDSKLIPYGDEPLADIDDDRNSDSDDEEADADGLTPAVLEAGFERTVSVDSW